MSPTAPRRATSVYELSANLDLSRELFLAIATARDLRHAHRQKVPTEAQSLADLGDLQTCIAASDRYQTSTSWHVTIDHADDVISRLELDDGSVFIWVMAKSSERAHDVAATIHDQLIAPEPDRGTTARVMFWSLPGDGSPRCVRRDIAAQPWESVMGNYSSEARGGVERLKLLNGCPDARLILWHGPPGTGKTHALRCLALAWSDWCTTHYICDPEKLLNNVAGYLLDVVASADERWPGRNAERAKLLVLEDSGELMNTDARNESGQALSRVLNLTDGMLGQGMDLMVLITTNEPLGTLHPAVTRPGRCLAEIEFGAMSVEEANTWLSAQGSTRNVAVDATLADLYAIARGEEPKLTTRRPVGFAA